jgi:hypothetical protein
MATAAQLATIKAWAGSTVDLSDVDARLTELGSPEAVALQLLRTRLSDMLNDPAKLDVDGDVSADWSANIAALRAQVTSLQTVVDDLNDSGPGQVTVTPLGRAGRRR